MVTGIVEARQYLSSKRRLPSFATPIDPTNPYRLGGLAGWTARGECVELKRVGQASLEAQGRCAMAVSQSGSYVFRVTVPGYEPAESDVLCVTGPQPQPQPLQQQPPPMRVGVWLRPKWAKCLLILTRTSQLAASDLDLLKGQPIPQASPPKCPGPPRLPALALTLTLCYASPQIMKWSWCVWVKAVPSTSHRRGLLGRTRHPGHMPAGE